MHWVGAVPTLLVLYQLTTPTTAYSFYAGRIPNGDHVPHPCKPNYVWHGVGHTNPLGGGERNDFGKDFRNNGARWDQTLCQMDSDGDGMTNGQELGDPDCVWSVGNLPNRTTSITHPGVCDPWTAPQCLQKNTWVQCDVETFNCDALQNDPDVRNVTLRFPPTPVPNTETNYYCMTFDLPGEEAYHLVATEPYIDTADVMHHILVYDCEGDDPPSVSQPTPCGMEVTSGCDNLIGLWAVGVAGSCINPKAGFLFGKGAFTRVKMEFHWNNPELRADYVDSSGMRIFYTPNLRPNSAATMTVGQSYLEIPPLQPSVEVTGSCSSECTSQIVKEPFYVIDALNHMHYMGRSQKVEVFRENQLVATLTNDEVYNYDAPVSHVHDPPIKIQAGDEIRTTCEFSSQYKSETTFYGEATSDEMCFAFLTVYPREALTQRTCVGYRDESVCSSGAGGCDFSTFLNASVPEMYQFITGVSAACQPFGPCTSECAQVLETVEDNPCMKGGAFDMIKHYMLQDKNSLYFLAQLLSCPPEPACPTCPECTTTTTTSNNNRNDNGDDTGDATSVVPGLLSVALLLIASFVFN